MQRVKITGGFVVDGTGTPGRLADVILEGDHILQVGGDYSGSVDETVDAKKCVVAPGFIDAHSHADFTILDRPLAEYRTLQGITTEVVGNCALGLAPVNEAMQDFYKLFIHQFFPGVTIRMFPTFTDQMVAVAQHPAAVNLAYLVPHGIIRLNLMNIDPRDPTPAEIDQMSLMVDDAMAQGAFGLSTGLVYPAGVFSKTSELVAVARPVAKHGGVFTSHIRNEGRGVVGAIDEILQVSRETGVRVQISHLKAGGLGSAKNIIKAINLITNARAAGTPVTADMYPYDSGSTDLGLVIIPTWAYKDLKGYLARPECRARIIKETIQNFIKVGGLPNVLAKFPRKWLLWAVFKYVDSRVLIINTNNTPGVNGKTLGDALEFLHPGQPRVDQMFQFLATNNGSASVAMKMFTEQKNIPPLLRQPWVCFGSDGFTPVTGNIHPRASGMMGKILGQYVREMGLLSLEEAVHKATAMPAQIFDIRDRGILAPNMKADVVIFDPNTIADRATFADASQTPSGIHHVFVNGVQVVNKGQVTGSRPGLLLRHQSTKQIQL